MRTPTRIIGVDTSLRSTGIGIIDAEGTRLKAVYYGRIRNKPSLPHSGCLLNILAGITDLIEEYKPAEAALEGGFYCKNPKTAMVLGEARGVVIAVAAQALLPVFEYSPRKVKQAVVGTGTAQKDQVGAMVQRLLALDKVPQNDEADALAIAICHIHGRGPIPELREKPI